MDAGLRVVPGRSTRVQAACVLGGFAAGPLLALGVGGAFFPGSSWVATVALFGFVVTFLGGLLVWMGLGIVTVVGRFLTDVVRRRVPPPPAPDGSERLVPSGYASFIVLGTLTGVATGLMAGVFTAATIGSAVVVWTAAGAAYGWALRTAAHHGYLPFPEPD